MTVNDVKGRLPGRNRSILGFCSLGAVVAWTLCMPISAQAGAVSESTGSLEFEIIAPAVLPPNIRLNIGGTFPSRFLFPDPGNAGAGSLIGLGEAGCTPDGCADQESGTDINIQLSTDLTCTSSPDGTYGGLEDTFAGFAVSRGSAVGTQVSFDLRFTTSWSVSANVTDPDEDAAEARVDILWAVPSEFCIELTSCTSGSLIGASSSAACPAGSMLEGTLFLGNRDVNSASGNDSDSAAAATCDVRVTWLAGVFNSVGGLMSATSSCSAISCGLLALSNETIEAVTSRESCQIAAGPNYTVAGPSGDLTLRAGKQVRLANGFSVAAGGQLTVELDSGLLP